MTTTTVTIDKQGVYHLTPAYQELQPFEDVVWVERGGQKITVDQPISYDNNCPQNPVYLRWLNRLGGIDYWLFHGDYSKHIKTKTEQTYSVFQEDLEQADNPLRVLKKSAQPSIKCRASLLTRDEVEGLEHLLTSVHIEMLVSYQDSIAEWQIVTLKDRSYNQFIARATLSELEIEIELPKLNLQHG